MSVGIFEARSNLLDEHSVSAIGVRLSVGGFGMPPDLPEERCLATSVWVYC